MGVTWPDKENLAEKSAGKVGREDFGRKTFLAENTARREREKKRRKQREKENRRGTRREPYRYSLDDLCGTDAISKASLESSPSPGTTLLVNHRDPPTRRVGIVPFARGIQLRDAI